MERLTTKSVLGGWTLRVPRQEAIDRLAAYEDAGLEPEEVAEYKRLCDSYVQAGLDAKFIQFCIDATKSGLTIGGLRELAQAEKDGRLVVLPETSVLDRKSFVDGLRDYFQEASYCDISTGIFGMSEGEKKLASALMNTLTREEAEAALKKREEADNEAD